MGNAGSGARGPRRSARRHELVHSLRSLAHGREGWRHACGGGTWRGRRGNAAADEGHGEHGRGLHQLRRHLLAADRRRIGLPALGEKWIRGEGEETWRRLVLGREGRGEGRPSERDSSVCSGSTLKFGTRHQMEARQRKKKCARPPLSLVSFLFQTEIHLPLGCTVHTILSLEEANEL